MKRRRKGGRGGGGRSRIAKEDEGEIADILLNLPDVVEQSELISKSTFTWDRKKKRSVMASISKASPEEVRAVEDDDEGPSTTLCLLRSGTGNDGASESPKQQSSSKKLSKRKVLVAMFTSISINNSMTLLGFLLIIIGFSSSFLIS